MSVTVPVTATVGPVHLRLFPFQVVGEDELPWAWLAVCRVKFRIGELTTTKRVRAKYVFWGSKPWPSPERPPEWSLAEGRRWVLDHLRTQLARHGFEPPELVIVEEAVEPVLTPAH